LVRFDEVETIAVGGSIRVLRLLEKKYGRGRWRKLKGVALARLPEARSRRPRYTGTRPTAWVARIFESSVF